MWEHSSSMPVKSVSVENIVRALFVKTKKYVIGVAPYYAGMNKGRIKLPNFLCCVSFFGHWRMFVRNA